MNTDYKETLWDGNHPSGLKIGKSIEPTNRMGFNEWAQNLNVSGGFVEPPQSTSAMEMISRYGIQGSGSYKVF